MNAAIEFLVVDLVYTDFFSRTRFCGAKVMNSKAFKLWDRLWTNFSFLEILLKNGFWRLMGFPKNGAKIILDMIQGTTRVFYYRIRE